MPTSPRTLFLLTAVGTFLVLFSLIFPWYCSSITFANDMRATILIGWQLTYCSGDACEEATHGWRNKQVKHVGSVFDAAGVFTGFAFVASLTATYLAYSATKRVSSSKSFTAAAFVAPLCLLLAVIIFGAGLVPAGRRDDNCGLVSALTPPDGDFDGVSLAIRVSSLSLSLRLDLSSLAVRHHATRSLTAKKSIFGAPRSAGCPLAGLRPF